MPIVRGRRSGRDRRLRRRNLAAGAMPRLRLHLSRPGSRLRRAARRHGMGEDRRGRTRTPRRDSADLVPAEPRDAAAHGAAAAQADGGSGRAPRAAGQRCRSRLRYRVAPDTPAGRLCAVRDRDFGRGRRGGGPDAGRARRRRIQRTGALWAAPLYRRVFQRRDAALLSRTRDATARRAARAAAHAGAGRRRPRQGAELRLAEPPRHRRQLVRFPLSPTTSTTSRRNRCGQWPRIVATGCASA